MHKSLQKSVIVKVEITSELRKCFPFLEELSFGSGPANKLSVSIKKKIGGLGGGTNRFANSSLNNPPLPVRQDAEKVVASKALAGDGQVSGKIVALIEQSAAESEFEDPPKAAKVLPMADLKLGTLSSASVSNDAPASKLSNHRMTVANAQGLAVDTDEDSDLEDEYNFTPFNRTASQTNHRMTLTTSPRDAAGIPAPIPAKRSSLEGMYSFSPRDPGAQTAAPVFH